MTGYGTIYRFEFDGTCKPFNNQPLLVTKCKVLILKKGYSGTITDIPHGQVSPVEIDYPTADDDIFYPLRGSMLSFNVYGGAINMDSIISEDETEYFLEYYRDNLLFWSGFVSPELCEEDIFLKYPAIQFKTIDGLSLLKGKELKINNKAPKGFLSLLTIVQNALNSIGYGYPLNVLCKSWNLYQNKTDYSTPLEQSYIYTASLQDKNFNYKDNSNIVLDTCNLFNSLVYQNYGEWYFVKTKDLAYGINQASKFDINGNLNTSSKRNIPILTHGVDFLIIAEPRRKIRRFYKEVQVEYQRGDNKFINGAFNIFDGTQNEIAYTSSLDLNSGSYSETNFFKINKSFLGTPKTYSLYDSVTDKYYLGLTSSIADSGNVFGISIRVIAKEPFNLSIKTVTGNPAFSIRVTRMLPLGSYETLFYNFTDSTWQTTEYVFKKGTNYDTDTEFLFNQSFQYPPQWDDDYILNDKTYSVSISLYAQTRAGFTGNQTIYEQVLLNGTGQYFDKETGTFPIFYTQSSLSQTDSFKLINPKKASISPDKKIVYNGDRMDGESIFGTDYNYSHIFSYNGTEYVTSNSWYERNEYDPAHPELGGLYYINELCARNILNQYSDYRNIFTGTIIGKNLQYGAIYEFPIQGALAGKKFFPLSIKLNERDCTADVVFMELSPNEIDAQMIIDRYDVYGNLISSQTSESKKKIVMG